MEMVFYLRNCWRKYFFSTVGGDTDSSFLMKWLKSAIFLLLPTAGSVTGAKGDYRESWVCLVGFREGFGLDLEGFFFYLAMPPIYMNWI